MPSDTKEICIKGPSKVLYLNVLTAHPLKTIHYKPWMNEAYHQVTHKNFTQTKKRPTDCSYRNGLCWKFPVSIIQCLRRFFFLKWDDAIWTSWIAWRRCQKCGLIWQLHIFKYEFLRQFLIAKKLKLAAFFISELDYDYLNKTRNTYF